MRCPQCGTEVGEARFCGSCGTPMQAPAAAYQQPYQQPYQPPYQQPYPMPMPPKKKSLTWLWITLGVVGFLLLAFVALLVFVDPGPEPGRPAPVTTATSATADGALKSYLEARKAGDMAAAYGLLSPKAREAYSQADYSAFYDGIQVTSFGKVEVVKAQDPWFQVVVHDLNNGDYTYPSAPYTVVKADGKFWVALENPLNARMDKAFTDKQYVQALTLADQMLAINPNSYYAYYNRGWAQAEQKQYQPALDAFSEAGKHVLPEDKPDLVRSVATVNGRMGQWDRTVTGMGEARKLAESFRTLYDDAWRNQVDADLAVAYEQTGYTPLAIDLLEKIYQADPESPAGRSLAVKLERKPYKVANGQATYKLVLQGITFALPQDWVVSSETTGGDWWFARHPASPKDRSDLAVYFHGDYLGKSMDDAVAGLLKRYQEPIGAPKQDIAIRTKQAITLDGEPAVRLEFSTGSVSVLAQAGNQAWVDFHWNNSNEAKAAYEKWLPTVQFAP